MIYSTSHVLWSDTDLQNIYADMSNKNIEKKLFCVSVKYP